MRIGINAFPLRTDGGGARYVFGGLMRALLRLDKNNRYIIFAHPDGAVLVNKVLEAGGESPGSWPAQRIRVERILDEGQIHAFRDDFDLYFGPLNNLNPRVYDRPTVALLHDIQEQFFPENFSKAELVGRRETYPDICRSATILVTISEFCKQSFVEKFDIDPRKIEVVPNAPQAELVNGKVNGGMWRREPLPGNYIFYPANTYKHKNHRLLLDAVEQMRAQGFEIPVVFSGFELQGGFPLRKEIAARGLEHLCRFYTDLPVDEMRYLYSHALATVLPTSFEGFCMPAIEAMACGCPVVCSDMPVLREVVGENALYFDYRNVGDLQRQLARVREDAELRQRLAMAGPPVASRFSWDSSARRILELFDEAQRRFVWGYEDPQTTRRPRIGISIRLLEGGPPLRRSVQSLIAANDPTLVIRCVADGALDAELREFLQSANVLIEPPGAHASGSLEDLLDFSTRHNLDVVGEVLEGNALKRSALDSLTWSYLMAPDKAVYLGECYQWRGEHFVGVSRLRLTGDGLWKMEGFPYPEALFLNPRVLAQWPEGMKRMAEEGVEDWRWELLREARYGGQLFISRRTLADCDQATLGPNAGKQAARVGMFHYYNASSEQSVKVKLMRRVEPVIKRAARVLPMKWQDAGTRLWYHLSR